MMGGVRSTPRLPPETRGRLPVSGADLFLRSCGHPPTERVSHLDSNRATEKKASALIRQCVHVETSCSKQTYPMCRIGSLSTLRRAAGTLRLARHTAFRHAAQPTLSVRRGDRPRCRRCSVDAQQRHAANQWIAEQIAAAYCGSSGRINRAWNRLVPDCRREIHQGCRTRDPVERGIRMNGPVPQRHLHHARYPGARGHSSLRFGGERLRRGPDESKKTITPDWPVPDR
jgi:hypothetical protein